MVSLNNNNNNSLYTTYIP